LADDEASLSVHDAFADGVEHTRIGKTAATDV
jgi:hypothetical protein